MTLDTRVFKNGFNLPVVADGFDLAQFGTEHGWGTFKSNGVFW